MENSETLELHGIRFKSGQLSTPEVPQIDPVSGNLHLSRFEGDADVILRPWEGIKASQLCWIAVHCTRLDGTSHQVYLAEAHPVSNDEVSKGLLVKLPRGELEPLSNGSELVVLAKVAFDPEGDESDADLSSALTTSVIVLERVEVAKATGANRDQLDTKDFMTEQYVNVTVPAYPDMAAGHKVYFLWSGTGSTYGWETREVTEAGALQFQVPVKHLSDAIGKGARVEYQLERAPGQNMEGAEPVLLTVTGQPIALALPTYLRATQQVSVMYALQAAEHTVQVVWEGVKTRRSNFQAVVKGTPNLFVMDRLWVTENIGKTVLVKYSVKLNSSGEEFMLSQVLEVKF